MNGASWIIGWVVGVVLSWFGLGRRDAAPPRAVPIEAQAVDDAFTEELKRERASLDEHRQSAPYRQTRTIRVDPAAGKILGFAPLADGRLAVLSGRADAYGAADGTTDPDGVRDRLVWMSADGAEEKAVPLDFTPRGVAVAADGSLWVVGGSMVAHFAADGARLEQVEAPHFDLSPEGREEFADEARAAHAAELESTAKSIERQLEMVEELDGKKEGDPGFQPAEIVALYRTSSAAMQARLESRRAMSEAQVVDEAIERVKQIHRVAVTPEALFLVTNMESGYGFSVWRCSLDLGERERIVSDLAGCCGQMDVQAVAGRLVIAENSRHRVRLVGFDGEAEAQFGETSRADVTKGFGGCCNPMNTCAAADGSLLTSESNGLVKRYGVDGTFLGVVGVADVQSGCKNSSIGMSADGATLYYLDVHEGCVVVLDRAE